MTKPRWLLLTHQLPSEPSNIRVKVWRKLQAFGAVPIKNSIYALPNRAESREDFEWLRKEIVQMKGDASVFLADPVSDSEDQEIIETFRKARAVEFDPLIKKAEEFARGIKNTLEGGPLGAESFHRLHKQWSGLRAEWERLQKIDYFQAPNGRKAEGAIKAVQKLIAQAEALRHKESPEAPAQIQPAKLKSKSWVTRTSPHIDRLACAWLVRRFVDQKARFKFVVAPHPPRSDEVRFDMPEAEFTHFGDWCTFETMTHRFGLEDPVLLSLAEIIHDVDLKDDKFGRPEAAGVALAIRGICQRYPGDARRLEAGIDLFEGVYAALAAEAKQ